MVALVVVLEGSNSPKIFQGKIELLWPKSLSKSYVYTTNQYLQVANTIIDNLSLKAMLSDKHGYMD